MPKLCPVIFKCYKTGIPGKCLPRDSKQIHRIYNISLKIIQVTLLLFGHILLLSAIHLISRVMRRIKGSEKIYLMFTLHCRKVLSLWNSEFPVTRDITRDPVLTVSGMKDGVQVHKSGMTVHLNQWDKKFKRNFSFFKR